ncbi:MAG TPA: pyrroline-5-carboxylate reductase [Anaerolineaceae bacterium]|nr:pyrroline-5-carboxylate reductase [Anaerolineaceae bacterium]HPN52676.1 pyrroline-5-carboxylate reductase [Anaerolineaceae bacterium]
MDHLPIITFIGPGVMAEAMISGLIRQAVADAGQIRASGPHNDRVTDLQARYGLAPFTDNAAAVADADVVVLSVKPQRLDKVLTALQGKISPNALVLSIVAGAPILTLQTGLQHPHLVRAMPNTPAQIGEGITVWTAAASVSEEQRELARKILGALGEQIFVEEESYLDMATAVSGSGPAYIFLFLEAMIDAGVHLGLPRRIAEQMVVQTLKGSVDYYQKNKLHPATMRNQVTSPGGTSAAALYYLEKAGFRTAISRAIWAAYERSVELGQKTASAAAARSPERNSD